MMKAAVCHVVVLMLGIVIVAEAKQFNRCEFAAELQRLGARDDMLADWVCLAEEQSTYTTSKVRGTVWRHDRDWGLFAISDLYWCDPISRFRRVTNYVSPNICNVSCNALIDDDIADDFACASEIFNRHGLGAWQPWSVHCLPNNDIASYITDCIEDKIVQPLTFTDDDDKPEMPANAPSAP